MTDDKIEAVPSGLVSCFLGQKEVPVLVLGTQQLMIRSDEAFSNEQQALKLYFHRFHESCYEKVLIQSYQLLEEKEETFSYKLSFLIRDEAYAENVKRTIVEYSRYIVLKNRGQENEFSEEMAGYPAEKDYEFYEFYSDQKRDWMLNIDNSSEALQDVKGIEMAVSLNCEALYKQYLALGLKEFTDCYLQENHADHLALFKRPISRLYIGNEFCHLLFPEEEQLFEMMDKAAGEKLKLTVCFTYMNDCYIEQMDALIDKLYHWAEAHEEKVEVVLNDWGMLELLKDKKDRLQPVLGVLLNKQIKDPRMRYKQGYEMGKALLAENSLNSKAFTAFLKEYGMTRYEYEACGYRMKIAGGRHSLHLPFYVTNVSQYCPLYAMCTQLDRGHQRFVKSCPKYCSDYIFSYPKHLKMVGRFNSLFAFDDSVLANDEQMLDYFRQGIDRLVLNYI